MGIRTNSKKNRHDKGLGTAETQSVGFESIRELSLALESPFLKERVKDYITSAGDLARLLASHDDPPAQQVRGSLQRYAKRARLLDLILAVTASAGSITASQRSTAQKIRTVTENHLAPMLHNHGDGVVSLKTKATAEKVKTHSALGRRLASLFARVVPPTARDQTKSSSLAHVSFLPESTENEIRLKLKKAEELCRKGRATTTEPIYKEILAIDRKNPEAIKGLGYAYLELGEFANAIPYLQEALLFYPQDVALLNFLGEALVREGRFEESIKHHQEALQLDPGNMTTYVKMGKSFILAGQDDKACEALERSINLMPQSVEALANYGLYLHVTHQFEKAALTYLKALKLSPNNIFVLANMGTLRGQQNKNREGLTFFNKALQVEPNSRDVKFMKSQLLLAEGEYQEGWALYEAGLGTRDWRGNPLITKHPIWAGETDPQMRLLIHKEQGLGDSLQFVRYAALCKQRVGKVFVLCPEPLARLLKECPFIDEIFTDLPSAGKYDKQIAMLSLPHIFKTTLENVPDDIPYLFVPPDVRRNWAHQVVATGEGKLRVGLVWSGGMFIGRLRGDQRAKRRNTELHQLMPILDCPNVQFYSLQMGTFAKQMDEYNLRDRFVDLMPQVKDMADTAAIIEQLDLVIAVDTSVAHLAGGLGKPVWILSRLDACWRWLNNKPTNPWYPTARIFGQERAGDWEPVVAAVAEALRETAAAKQSPPAG